MELWFTLCVKVILLLSGVMNMLQTDLQPRIALCVFLALACSFAVHLPKKKYVAAILIVIYCLTPFLLPEMLCMIPVIVYDAVYRRLYPVLLAAVPAFLYLRPVTSLLVLILIACGLAALLAFALSQLLLLTHEIQETQDQAKGAEITAEKEKQALTEKQDAEVYAATLKERNRIAREIHDNVGHMLSRAILLTGALKTVSADEELTNRLNQLDTSLNEAMDTIRASVHDLYDDSLDLKQASETLVRDFTACPVTLSYQCSSLIPREVKYCFLAILKEALVNIGKHSDATAAHVTMTEHPALYQMTIQDNGKKKAATEGPAGIGLTGMCDRVAALHGTIRFSDDNGFRIFLTIPKEQEAGA